MPDLSHLGNLQPAEPLDLGATYPANRANSFRLPVRGKYTLQAPPSFPQAAFSATNAGNLLVEINPTIVGPTNEGFTVRRTKVSAKVFERKGKKVSYLGDYLKSTGYDGPLNTVEQQAEAVEQSAGKTFEAELDWRAEDFATQYKLEGMSRFPRNTDGTYQSWVNHPTATNEDGSPKRLLASLFVRNYLDPSEAQA